MKTLKITMFFVFVWQFHPQNNETKTDYALYDLKGKVKSFREWSECVDEAQKEEVGCGNIIREVNFDQKGKMSVQSNYDDQGRLTSRDTSKYNENGHQIELEMHGVDNWATVKSKFIYNHQGGLTKRMNYIAISHTNWFHNSTTLYDAKGNIVEIDEFNKDGSIRKKTNVHYTFKGDIMEADTVTPGGSLIAKTIYEYDSAGNPIGKKVKDRNGKIQEKTTIDYVGTGNRLETEYTINKDNNLERSTANMYDSRSKSG